MCDTGQARLRVGIGLPFACSHYSMPAIYGPPGYPDSALRRAYPPGYNGGARWSCAKRPYSSDGFAD